MYPKVESKINSMQTGQIRMGLFSSLNNQSYHRLISTSPSNGGIRSSIPQSTNSLRSPINFLSDTETFQTQESQGNTCIFEKPVNQKKNSDLEDLQSNTVRQTYSNNSQTSLKLKPEQQAFVAVESPLAAQKYSATTMIPDMSFKPILGGNSNYGQIPQFSMIDQGQFSPKFSLNENPAEFQFSPQLTQNQQLSSSSHADKIQGKILEINTKHDLKLNVSENLTTENRKYNSISFNQKDLRKQTSHSQQNSSQEKLFPQQIVSFRKLQQFDDQNQGTLHSQKQKQILPDQIFQNSTQEIEKLQLNEENQRSETFQQIGKRSNRNIFAKIPLFYSFYLIERAFMIYWALFKKRNKLL